LTGRPALPSLASLTQIIPLHLLTYSRTSDLESSHQHSSEEVVIIHTQSTGIILLQSVNTPFSLSDGLWKTTGGIEPFSPLQTPPSSACQLTIPLPHHPLTPWQILA
jgi:hypothetical protein